MEQIEASFNEAVDQKVGTANELKICGRYISLKKLRNLCAMIVVAFGMLTACGKVKRQRYRSI